MTDALQRVDSQSPAVRGQAISRSQDAARENPAEPARAYAGQRDRHRSRGANALRHRDPDRQGSRQWTDEPRDVPAVPDRPLVAIDRVHFSGEPVAAVVATDIDAASDAVEAIEFEYEELPAAFTSEEGPFAARTQLAETLRTPASHVRVIVPNVAAHSAANRAWPPRARRARAGEFYTITRRGVGRRARDTGHVGRPHHCRQRSRSLGSGGVRGHQPTAHQERWLQLGGSYRIPDISIESFAVYTKTTPAGGFRGHDGSQVAWAQMDIIAGSAEGSGDRSRGATNLQPRARRRLLRHRSTLRRHPLTGAAWRRG